MLLDPHLLAQAARGKRRHGRAGGGGLVRSVDRGRYVKPLIPHGPIHHVAIDATLRGDRCRWPHQPGLEVGIAVAILGSDCWHFPLLKSL